MLNILQKMGRPIARAIDRAYIGQQEFVIVANNCWGAEIYKHLGRPYNTPFVGLFIFSSDYIQLLEQFDFYLQQPLQFTQQSKWLTHTPDYPIGLLKDVEIHFMHYANEEVAYEKWNRRLARMQTVINRDQYYFKICDRDGNTPAMMDRFYQLPFVHKISFGVQPYPVVAHVQIQPDPATGETPDGLKLFWLSYAYTNIWAWLKTGTAKKSGYSRLKARLQLT